MRHAKVNLVAGLATFAAAAWWTACASGGAQVESGEAGPDGQTLMIEVENNLTPSVSVTVLVDDPTEIERVLGPVNTGRTETFPVDTSNLTAGFRLVAEAADGTTIRSDPVDALGGATVTWDLEQNLVRVRPSNDDERSPAVAVICVCGASETFAAGAML